MDSRAALIAIARYARGQWGMVTSAQAVAAGVSYMQIKRMTEAGLLEKAGSGVYVMIGGQAAAERNQDYKVAWLRLDPAVPGWERPLLGPNSAVISHSSAAVLLRLGDLVVRDVEFTTTRRRTSRDPAVKLHQAPLASYDVTWADGLPVTTATRTLVDLLADGITARHAGSFLAEALDRRMLNVDHVIQEVAPHARRYGCPDRDGQALVETLLSQVSTPPGSWDREQTVADLARELLKLSDDQLKSLHSLASAAREPAIAALLSRLDGSRGSGPGRDGGGPGRGEGPVRGGAAGDLARGAGARGRSGAGVAGRAARHGG